MEEKVSRKMSYIRNQVKQTSTDLGSGDHPIGAENIGAERRTFSLVRSVPDTLFLCRFGGEKSSSLALTKSLHPYYIKTKLSLVNPV
jgi:hypothetical protein